MEPNNHTLSTVQFNFEAVNTAKQDPTTGFNLEPLSASARSEAEGSMAIPKHAAATKDGKLNLAHLGHAKRNPEARDAEEDKEEANCGSHGMAFERSSGTLGKRTFREREQLEFVEHKARKGSRYWGEDEHDRFLEAVRLYGKNWGQITKHVGTRSRQSVYSHAQKFRKRVERQPLLRGAECAPVLAKLDQSHYGQSSIMRNRTCSIGDVQPCSANSADLDSQK